jgi:transcriptional antiterminator RfaH
MKKRWYLVYTKPRQESVAEENLQRQGFEIWLPRLRMSRRRRRRWVDVVEPLFPRYLFIRLQAGGDDFAPIRSTRGVSGLVRVGMDPAQVPDPVVEALQQGADPDSGLLNPAPGRLARGDQVEVLEGPFAGLRGVFQLQSGEDRVVVLLDVLGQANRVKLSRHQVTVVR